MVTDVAGGTMTLTVNGREHSCPFGTTLAELLMTLALDPRMIVVEHNRTIVRDRDRFGTVVLAPGDALELVHFVGGG